jgi:hypothetical protein
MFAIWDTLDPTSLDGFLSSITGFLYKSYTNQIEQNTDYSASSIILITQSYG